MRVTLIALATVLLALCGALLLVAHGFRAAGQILDPGPDDGPPSEPMDGDLYDALANEIRVTGDGFDPAFPYR